MLAMGGDGGDLTPQPPFPPREGGAWAGLLLFAAGRGRGEVMGRREPGVKPEVVC